MLVPCEDRKKNRTRSKKRLNMKHLIQSQTRQGPAVLAAGAGWVGYIFFYIFHLSSTSNLLFFGRQLNMTEIL